MENKTYDAVWQAANALVKDVGEGLVSEIIQGGYITDEGELHDAIHSAVDSALTYTVTHWVCAWGLPDCDEGFSDGAKTFDDALSLKAYENLMGAVNNQFGSRFQEMLSDLDGQVGS